MHYRTWLNIAIPVVLVVLVASGCSLYRSSGSEIDPPPEDMDVIAGYMADHGESGHQAHADEDMIDVTVYALDPGGYVVPLALEVPGTAETIARETLKYMVRGGAAEERIPEEFTPILPEGTEVIGMNIKPDKLAVVDFSNELLNYDPDEERKILESIVFALTEFDTIDRVQLWVNGKVLTEMPARGTPVSESMGRSMGINLERMEGTRLSQATPVTVYFQGETSDHRPYFVPVTRLIPYTDQPAEAAMFQLLAGPAAASVLDPVAMAGVKVERIMDEDGVIHIYLTHSFPDEDIPLPSPFVQSMVLSVTENSNASQVRILLNGETSTGEDESNSEAVARPDRINSLGI